MQFQSPNLINLDEFFLLPMHLDERAFRPLNILRQRSSRAAGTAKRAGALIQFATGRAICRFLKHYRNHVIAPPIPSLDTTGAESSELAAIGRRRDDFAGRFRVPTWRGRIRDSGGRGQVGLAAR